MKEYKRLTIRNSDGTVSQPYGENIVERVFYQLAELEDKIENGTLIELPCNIRDMVWFVYETENDGVFLDEGVIQSFNIDRCGLWFYVIYKSGLTYWHTIESIGERAFLTKSEAEKKLEELKNENIRKQ